MQNVTQPGLDDIKKLIDRWGSLDLSGTGITALPEGLTVGGVAPHCPDQRKAHLLQVAKRALQDGALEMGSWGDDEANCGTTMCIAGWAWHLTDDPAMKNLAPAQAGLLTLGPVAASHFYDSNKRAREYLESALEEVGK